MIYGSVCSGIEAATVAWHPLGWTPAFLSEIEAFPSAVLKHHYPKVENRGDMKKFKRWPSDRIDVLVGGTPCQSFSVAGLRKGLDDPRGNLALVFLAIADRLRPKWVVWENVPGVLSQDEGRAFGSIVGGLGELGYGWAYRVLNAQYFRVPQRRRRVFLVGHLGDWRRAAAVLFERQSLSWNPPPSKKAGERVTPTLDARAGRKGFDASEDGTGRGIPMTVCMSSDPISAKDVAMPITNRNGDPGVIAFTCKDHGADAGELAPTMRGMSHDRSHPNAGGQLAIANRRGVRRLTPLECERLQGFPDGYTKIRYRGKPAADEPRYKALGNSMARPVMEWLGSRIKCIHET